MFPEWLIGFYMTGMSHGRNKSSSVAKSCPEGFSAKSSLLFQLIPWLCACEHLGNWAWK